MTYLRLCILFSFLGRERFGGVLGGVGGNFPRDFLEISMKFSEKNPEFFREISGPPKRIFLFGGCANGGGVSSEALAGGRVRESERKLEDVTSPWACCERRLRHEQRF